MKVHCMENVNDKQLSFGQRNWFLLCVLVAILSPLFVHFIKVAAKTKNYNQRNEIRRSSDTDTAYHIASPPTGSAADSGTKTKSNPPDSANR